MSKRGIIAILIGIFSMGIIATPFILRAIPPRYVAAYFPEPLQDIVSPKTESPILPTIVQAADISVLLAQSTPENDVDLLAAPPATFTPVSVQGAEVAVADTAVPATSTPIPYPTNTPIPIPASARLEGFNHHFQEWNNCGPATMAMTLSYFGLGLTQTDTAADLKP
ncbi:MAG: hypothetical protein GY943_15365, partial [Chloroflexi bacterium]|nr:hypothetical protein [Chloroflexota bacterium]